MTSFLKIFLFVLAFNLKVGCVLITSTFVHLFDFYALLFSRVRREGVKDGK
mgnify:CR=1 FL=1